MTSLSLAKFLSCDGNSGSARNSSKPRETCTAPATLPLTATSVPSRTSTTSVLPLAIISFACAGVIFGTAALAASIICLTLVAIAFSLPPCAGYSPILAQFDRRRKCDRTWASIGLGPRSDLGLDRPLRSRSLLRLIEAKSLAAHEGAKVRARRHAILAGLVLRTSVKIRLAPHA